MSTSVPSVASLLKKTQIEDHAEVLKAAEAALKHFKGDLDAQHVQVVALLKLDRYDDAARAVEAGGAKLKERAKLEYAYALYKSGRPSEAAELAQDGTTRGFRHVEAQARYRIEDFARAAELYKELGSRLADDADADLRINTGAVDAQLEWAGNGEQVQKKKPDRTDLEAFETAYNAACGSIARDELAQGEVLLKRARDLCNALEDMSQEDKETELLPISVQQVYVLGRLGKLDDAEALARTIDPTNISDAGTRHIAQVNNVAAARTTANPFLSHRLVVKDLDELKPDYPFHFQSSALKQNHYAADIQSLKFGGTAESTAKAISEESSPNLDAFYNSLSVINAAAHAKSATGKEALKHILPLLEKRPNDVGLILTIVQLYVLTGNSGSATNLLESFLNRMEQAGTAAELDVRFAPGLVGAMVSLYHSQNRRAHVQRELAKAATHWRRKSKDQPAPATNLLKTAGSALLESNDSEHQELAKEIFTELHQQDQDDRYSAAGLLAASPQLASTTQTSLLTPIDRLISGIDADALENAGIAQPLAPGGAAVATRKRHAEEIKPKKSKKIRKSRIPKDYEPDKTPDAERWLPLRDRSTYRPKGKKGKAKANLLSQGAAPAEGSDGSRPGTPGGEVGEAETTAAAGWWREEEKG